MVRRRAVARKSVNDRATDVKSEVREVTAISKGAFISCVVAAQSPQYLTVTALSSDRFQCPAGRYFSCSCWRAGSRDGCEACHGERWQEES